ncbi:MAG: sugar kinase [Pseudolysinimonas sp.]
MSIDDAPINAPFDVVTVGEALVAMTPWAGDRLAGADQVTLRTAGAEVNVARTLAHLGNRVAWVGALGADPLGDRIVADLSASGVDVSYVTRDVSAPTGLYLKDTDPSRATSMYYYRRNSAASKMDASVIRDLPGRRVLHLTGITAAISDGGLRLARAAVSARRDDSLVSFDVNFRPALWQGRDATVVLAELANAADVVFVGLDEAGDLWGTGTLESIRALLPAPTAVIVKDGDVGATAMLSSGESIFEAAPRIEVIEPVGAGDAFAAGYLHGLIAGSSERERLQFGHAAAGRALVTTDDVGSHSPGGVSGR